MGELLSPPHFLSPPRVRIAMAMKQAQKQTSRTTARKAKKVMPPKKQVRITANAV